jgi:hypothetical protein
MARLPFRIGCAALGFFGVSLSSDGDATTACGSCLEPAMLFCFVYHSKFDVLLWPAFSKVHGGDVLAYHEACSSICSMTLLDQTVAVVSCCKAERVKAVSS